MMSEIISEDYFSDIDAIYDIDDISGLGQLLSSFITANCLPNIIVEKRVNETLSEFKINDLDLAELLAQCKESGFLESDESPLVKSILEKRACRSSATVPHAKSPLHPLTALYSLRQVKKQSVQQL